MFLAHLLTIKMPSLAPVIIFIDCVGCQPSFVSEIIRGGGILFSDTVSFRDCFDGGRMTYVYAALRD